MPVTYNEWAQQLQEYYAKVYRTDEPEVHGWGIYLPCAQALHIRSYYEDPYGDWQDIWEDEDYIPPPALPNANDFPALGVRYTTAVTNKDKQPATRSALPTGQHSKQRKKFVKLEAFEHSITKDQTSVTVIATASKTVTPHPVVDSIRAVPVHNGTQDFSKAFDSGDRKTGDITPAGIPLCPLLAVARFATKYVRESFSERVEAAFFADGKIWTREWDLYYIWNSVWYTPCPIIFVPTTQVATLIQEINAMFPDLQWKATPYDDARGLRVGFFDEHDDLRPRWLGKSQSKADYELMRNSVNNPINVGRASPRGTHFAMSMRIAVSGAAYARSRHATVSKKWNHLHMLEVFEAELARVRAYLYSPQELQDPVLFIAIDCEAFECDKGQVLPKRTTEVGITTLDTRDIQGVDPGLAGANWHKHLRARHFLIKERRHLKNFRWVAGHPDQFQFGKTEVVPLNQAASYVESCFCDPYSAGDSYLGYDTSKRRRVVLVGHDLGGDLDMVSSLGFSWDNRPYIVDRVDTVRISTILEFDRLRKQKLTRIVRDFGFPTPFAHNAGNDAVFTMWALLGFAADKNTDWFL